MEIKKIAFILGLIFLISITSALVFAQGSLPPFAFKGDVTVNGAQAPDNLIIEAKKTNGNTVGAGTTLNGDYGSPDNIFIVEDPPNENLEGQTIQFFVEGVLGGQVVLAAENRGDYTFLDLSVTLSSPSGGTGDDTGGGGGG